MDKFRRYKRRQRAWYWVDNSPYWWTPYGSWQRQPVNCHYSSTVTTHNKKLAMRALKMCGKNGRITDVNGFDNEV